ncbi:MAG TPA: GNAT family N-acetyltransferase [Acidimicrobiales bacterium]
MRPVAIVPVAGDAPTPAGFLASFPAHQLAPYEWLTGEDAIAIAVSDGAVVGAAFAHAGHLHPARAWAAVLVDPSSRRRGIGTALHHALLDRTTRPLRAKVDPTNTAAVAFAHSLRLTTLVASHVVRVPAETRVPTMELPAGVRAEEIPLPPPDDVCRAAVSLYERIHAWDPVAPGSGDSLADAL